MSIRQKILLTFFLSGLLVILISSGTYYHLLVKDIRTAGHRHVGIAFDMMFEELDAKAGNMADRMERFTRDTLSIHLFVISVSQRQLGRMETMENWESWRSVQEIISRLRAMGEATEKFASLSDALEVAVYDTSGRLMVACRNGERPARGVFLSHRGGDTFLPLETIDAESWYWRGTGDIPRNPLPEGLPPAYPGDAPDTFEAILGQTGGIVTTRFSAPVFRQDKLQGFCVIHVPLSPHNMERYSRYSQTSVNVFANSALSVGTLAEYGEFPGFRSEPLHDPGISERHAPPDLVFAEIGGRLHYQGKIGFGEPGGDIVTVTANFPHHKEVAKAKKIIVPIVGIAILLALLMTLILALLLQVILVRPLREILGTANAVARGDLGREIRIASRDEIGKLGDAFRHMRDTIGNVLHDMEALIQAIRSGHLDTQGNPDAYHGDWRELIMGTNSVIDAFVLPLGMAANCLDRLSKGEIPEKITDEYQGDFDKIRNNLNMLIETTEETTLAAEAIAAGNLGFEVRERSESDRMMRALNRMIRRLGQITDETGGMIQAVGMGRLDVRGNAEAFEGGWRKLVGGVNDLIGGLSHAVSRSAALSQEMELARKIQTVLLPEKPRISGYDIAANCQPSDQVGGDYYDVISVSGYDWIVIGDVSGHGVAAGLVMMMVQTAIHTVLNENPQMSPSRVLSMVNRTIHGNLERMNESKHMTIIVLAAGKGGMFSFSGLHEDILIRRAETGEVETVDSDGMWIGLESDISGYLSDDVLRLAPGDILVLHTDGLTEAENPDGKMLDIEGFVEILERHAHREPEAMKDLIMADVLRWCDDRRADDMTLVIVKRRRV